MQTECGRQNFKTQFMKSKKKTKYNIFSRTLRAVVQQRSIYLTMSTVFFDDLERELSLYTFLRENTIERCNTSKWTWRKLTVW